MWYKVGPLAGSNGHYRELHNGIVSAQRGPAGAVLATCRAPVSSYSTLPRLSPRVYAGIGAGMVPALI
jgi:hypothetical protein